MLEYSETQLLVVSGKSTGILLLDTVSASVTQTETGVLSCSPLSFLSFSVSMKGNTHDFKTGLH